MKVVYVGDNRQRENFGCRATSTALSQLISEDNEIVGRITGRYNMWNLGDLFFISFLPEGFYKFASRLPGWQTFRKIWCRALSAMKKRKIYFSCFDFVKADPKKTRRNLIKCISANPTIKEFDLRNYDFDAMVINGEGSFIFATPPWRESLIIAMLMDWASDMGKKVYFMNAMFSDDPHSEHNNKTIEMFYPILKKCSAVYLREQYSMKYCKKYFPEINPVFKPDALFTWQHYMIDDFNVSNGRYFIPFGIESDKKYEEFDFTKPYICLTGSSASKLGNNLELGIRYYSELVERIKKAIPTKLYLIEVCTGDSFLYKVGEITNTPVIPVEIPILAAGKILSNAEIFITGRYHPAILASLGGTPCVIMSSNSHKTISLQELLEYPAPKEYSVLPNSEEQCEIVSAAENLYKNRKSERTRIRERCRVLSEEAMKMKEAWKV